MRWSGEDKDKCGKVLGQKEEKEKVSHRKDLNMLKDKEKKGRSMTLFI